MYSTWQLSFNHIKRQNKFSAKLLQPWACFDNQEVWSKLLHEVRGNAPEWFSYLTEDELSFDQAVRVLCDYGLAEVYKALEESGMEMKGHSMHSCVHSWTIHVLNQEWDAEMASLALECVGSHVPDSEAHRWWVTQRRLIRRVTRC